MGLQLACAESPAGQAASGVLSLVPRLARNSSQGLALIGPALHAWYGSLGRIVTATGTKGAGARPLAAACPPMLPLPRCSAVAAATAPLMLPPLRHTLPSPPPVLRMAADQLLFAPVFISLIVACELWAAIHATAGCCCRCCQCSAAATAAAGPFPPCHAGLPRQA